MKKILCIGSITVDIMASGFDKLPPPGMLVPFNNLAVEVGGCAANVAIDLAKLGGQTVLSCKIGKDMFGDVIAKKLSAHFPEKLKGVVVDKNVRTTVSIVLITQNGERGFLYNPGSTSEFSAYDIPDEILNDSDIVFVAGAMLLTKFDGKNCGQFLKKCKKLGKTTAMDTAWDFEDIWMPKILPSLPHLDFFMPSYDEAVKLSNQTEPSEIATKFRTLGAQNVIIKLGEDGALLSPKLGKEMAVPIFGGIPVIDTTGAGDSFCSGFLYGISNDWELDKCVIFGNAVAAHCITKIGASTGIPNVSTVIDFIKKRGMHFSG